MTLNHSGVMEIILHFHNYYFMNESKCPVPREQQPTNEFIELSKSKIFSWPKTKKSLIFALFKFWVVAFFLFIVISSGSIYEDRLEALRKSAEKARSELSQQEGSDKSVSSENVYGQ